MHLEHPLVMRLLNPFLMRGFQSNTLSRSAVLGTADDTAKLICGVNREATSPFRSNRWRRWRAGRKNQKEAGIRFTPVGQMPSGSRVPLRGVNPEARLP
jgi:hypothetical protein